MKTTKNLILYRDFENEQLFYDFTWVMENYQNEYYNKEDVEGLFYECLKKLMELAVSHGFSGNLWHNFLAFLLVNNENAYSRACEIRGEIKGSINEDRGRGKIVQQADQRPDRRALPSSGGSGGCRRI